MSTTLEFLPANRRVATPWKNGGGITREVAVSTSDAAPGFDWRLSIAEISRSGPFSHYAGIDRTLVLLSGELDLVLGDSQRRMRPDSDAVRFAGELPARAAPIGGTSSDLNVMVRRGAWRAEVESLRGAAGTDAYTDADVTILLALGELRVASAAGTVDLGKLDAARLDGTARLTIDRTVHDTPWLMVRLYSHASPARSTP